MIRIAVIGANGQAGRHIVAEALARGFEVTAFVRGSTAPAAQHVVHKDVLAIEQSDLAGFDAVVDALGFWTPDTLPLHVKTALHLADLLSGTKTRLLIVGGAGSLYMDAAHTQQLVDQLSSLSNTVRSRVLNAISLRPSANAVMFNGPSFRPQRNLKSASLGRGNMCSPAKNLQPMRKAKAL